MTPPSALAQLSRILAVRLDNIGDVVMLAPALRALREACPSASITLLASPAGAQAAALLPWIDDVIVRRALWQELNPGAVPQPADEHAFIAELASRRFQAALIFTSFSQSPYPPAYCCYLAGIPLRGGESREFGGCLLTHTVPPLPIEAHQVDRNIHLLEALGVPVKEKQIKLVVPPDATLAARALLRGTGIGPECAYIALVPGASCSARRYQAERFLMVGSLLSARLGWPAIALGTRREEASFSPLLPPGMTGLFGRTSVPDLAALIEGASFVVCNNSAALHLAEAFSRPVLAFYAGTDLEEQWRPRTSPSLLLRKDTDCAPCYRFQCPYDAACLDIDPEEAVDLALKLLDHRDTKEAAL